MAGLSGSGEWVLFSSASSLAVIYHLLNLRCDGLTMSPTRLGKGGDRAKSPLQPWEGELWLMRAEGD